MVCNMKLDRAFRGQYVVRDDESDKQRQLHHTIEVSSAMGCNSGSHQPSATATGVWEKLRPTERDCSVSCQAQSIRDYRIVRNPPGSSTSQHSKSLTPF